MRRSLRPFVIILTLLTTFLSGCSMKVFSWQHHTEEPCNNHAYIRMPLEEFITKRYHMNNQVRMAIIPFSVQANLARTGNNYLGWGNELAWLLHAKLLESGKIPMLEVFNPREWPGKREEFFTGSFTALSLAREAGYDLVFVGFLENLRSSDKLTALGKVIDTDSGITIWYGKSEVGEINFPTRHGDPWRLFGDRRLDQLNTTTLKDDLTRCLAENLLSDEPAP